jgi:hypothetical protein
MAHIGEGSAYYCSFGVTIGFVASSGIDVACEGRETLNAPSEVAHFFFRFRWRPRVFIPLPKEVSHQAVHVHTAKPPFVVRLKTFKRQLKQGGVHSCREGILC